ncbi:ATP-grasp domain-containing protein [Streptomyces sp. NPDC048518]|uniref:ATP-grasp domain-containing protein n=1 Tax=Streptomyces sp. NPDC048518 TaxID=3155029 RepID=UPI0033DC951C
MSKVLLVHAKGGPPLGHVLSRTAAKADVHLLALSALPPSVAGAARTLCASVVTPTEAQRSDLVSLIVAQAGAVGADAVLTFSEYAVVAVAEACEKLGLAGAGGAAALARDKRLMRRTWHEHGVPQPEFRPVVTEADLHEAAEHLPFPLLLKAAWSAGSTAHQIIGSPDELSAAWRRSREVMDESAQLGYAELHVAEANADFVVEQIVTGTAGDWFDEPGWGDYVSVEGVVADGVFRPVCLSGRMPTVEPFTERASITPALLASGDAQDRIVALARRSVDALGLRDCGTHTEIKLGADGAMWLIETAARFGGAMTVPQIEEVFGLDLIGMLVDHLLGRPVEWPAQALTPEQARGAAGSLVVLAVDGKGEAWQDRRIWDAAVAADVPLSPGSELSVVAESSLPDGDVVPVYDPAAGANTMAALCLLSATDPRTVLRDFETLIDALPRVLPAAEPEEVSR